MNLGRSYNAYNKEGSRREKPMKRTNSETIKPDIQIGISIYNQPQHWVEKCVYSALNQEGDYSIICTIRVDGQKGCDESTKRWLLELSRNKPELKIIFGEENKGTYGSYKEIFKQSDSKYLCQLDADDWLNKKAIKKCIDLLEARPESSFAYTEYNEVNELDEFVRVGARSEKHFSLNRQLVQFNTFHLRVVRRLHYNLAGGYCENLTYTGDYDLSLKLAEQARPIHISQALYNYRLHGSNTSIQKKEQVIKEAFETACEALKRRGQEHILELCYKYNKNTNSQVVNISPRKGPIIIAGMHRSGTSVLALILQKIGVDIGHRLIKPDNYNPDGYGEEQFIVEINRKALRRSTQKCSECWSDWGWSKSQSSLPIRHSDELWRNQARQYLNRRSNNNYFWGWKDPRNSLFLEDWIEIEPHSKVIGIYRYPWEMISALQRIEPKVFLSHPSWGLEIWNQYNNHLLSFYQKHPGHSILINSSTLMQNPIALLDTIKRKWGWPLNQIDHSLTLDIKKLVRPDRHKKSDAEKELIKLHMACSPRSVEIFKRLDKIADLPSPLKNRSQHFINPMRSRNNIIVSIIITSHNQGDTLLEALASVNKHRPLTSSEVLIIDDGSDDFRTCEVLETLKGEGLNIIRQKNQGVSYARNKGLTYANGSLLLFMDDDNRLLEPYLKKGLDIMLSNKKIDVLYGDRIEFGLRSRYIKIGKINANTLWQGNTINNCALIRRSYLERCGGYCKRLSGLGLQDWDLWLAGLSHPDGLNLSYLNDACFEYRVRPNSMMEKLFSDKEKLKEVMNIFREKYGEKITDPRFCEYLSN